MTIRVMLDSNAFDDILDSRCVDKLRQNVIKGEIAISITHVQIDELEKVKDIVRRNALLNLMTTLNMQILLPIGVCGGETARGYQGGKCGEMVCGDLGVLEEYPNTITESYPLGRKTGDLIILRAALDYGMDFLITRDQKDFQKALNLVKSKEGSSLQLRTIEDFMHKHLS